MLRIVLIASILITAEFLVDPSPSISQPGCGWREQRPYGGYCRGDRWGWYGARNPVTTMKDARALLERYFEGEGVVIGKISEREGYFEADIKDKKDALVDRVIVDKRTGRIRSIY